LTQTIARTIGFDDVYPMRQSVQQGARQPLTAKDLHTGLERQVRRDDQTLTHIGSTNEFEWQFSVTLLEWHISKLV